MYQLFLGFPKGLSVMLALLPNWIYGKEPFDAIRFEGPLKELKTKLANKEPVFESLLNRLIILNEHKVTIEMIPDITIEETRYLLFDFLVFVQIYIQM